MSKKTFIETEISGDFESLNRSGRRAVRWSFLIALLLLLCTSGWMYYAIRVNEARSQEAETYKELNELKSDLSQIAIRYDRLLKAFETRYSALDSLYRVLYAASSNATAKAPLRLSVE